MKAMTSRNILATRMAASYFKSFEDSTDLANEIENHLVSEGVLGELTGTVDEESVRDELIETTTTIVSKMLKESGDMLEYDADNAHKARTQNLERLNAVIHQFSINVPIGEREAMANALFGGQH